MQYGFVIDHSRCIGCHACTVACKSENDVPVGSFRTWVKYTEAGTFPAVKRSFAVLRCNQCTAAPCVTICPVNALEKRDDGIVDIDPMSCIGCKSCMQGCPYDALYLNDETGIAEKCHFCAHRTEVGLAPACAVVCPTEAIIPGDFDDPNSRVSVMKRTHALQARKTEAGTGPNVFYRDVEPAGIDPMQTNAAGGSIWADRVPGPQLDTAAFQALEDKAKARTTYDVAHPPLWGGKITGYLFTKAIAAGVFLAAGFAGLPPLEAGGHGPAWAASLVPILALVFLTATTLMLVLDLKRPERFFYILTRPNFDSWLVKGTYFLIAYGGLLGVWALASFLGGIESASLRTVLFVATGITAFLSAGYTGWLFGQSKGRVLWMRRGLWLHLMVQAVVAGAALLLVLSPLGFGAEATASVRGVLVPWLVLHAAMTFTEGLFPPRRREAEYARAHALVTKGPYARRHWRLGVLCGVVLPLLLLVLPNVTLLSFVTGALVLLGLFVEKDVLVRAGQATSIS